MSGREFIKRLKEEKLLLPPLAGFTDYPYRRILSEFNAPFLCTEMISCDALNRGTDRTMRMLEKPEGKHIHGAQIFGDDPDAVAWAAENIASLEFDYIDINMGCAVKTITQNGAGVSLMGEPDKAGKVVEAVVEAVSIPVTCKIRLGESRNELNAPELSKRLEAAGVTAITVHGRSGEKKFGEPVNHAAIHEVVEAVDVPVIGNGGVYTGTDAVEMMKTGVAAVMPGRALVGNPWIIAEIKAAFNDDHWSPPVLEERKETCLRHLEYLIEFSGEKDGVLTMRRVLPRYFMGAMYATDLRTDVVKVSTRIEVLDIIDKITLTDDQMVYNRG